jgi:hypothetical protein
MVVREQKDLLAEINTLRDSYLDGRSLAPVADAMASALDEVMKGDPDYAALNARIANPVGPQLVANPAVMDASQPESLRPQVAGDPEQTAPGTALTDEHIAAAVEDGAVNVVPPADSEVASTSGSAPVPTNASGEVTSAPAAERADLPAPEAQAVLDQQPATVGEAKDRAAETAKADKSSAASANESAPETDSAPAPDTRSDEDRKQDERLDRIEQEQHDERAGK